MKAKADSAKAMNTKKWVPKAETWDSVEEDEETWIGSGSSSNGDDSYHEEANWSCTSEEETDAIKAFNILKACKHASSGQPSNTDDAPEVEAAAPKQPDDAPEAEVPQQKPARTKLSSSALVFVPGARTSVPLPPGPRSADAGRDLLTLLKNDVKDCPNEKPAENPQKPRRTKLTSNAQVFVPRATVVQPATPGFVPMMAVLPTMLIPMCTNNDNNNGPIDNGFDDSPQVTPRMTNPDSEPEEANDAESDSFDGLQEHLTDSDCIQQSDDCEEVSPQPPMRCIADESEVLTTIRFGSLPPTKISWADLYEDDDEGNDLWLDTRAKNDLLSLS
jgi:hypothetical protein